MLLSQSGRGRNTQSFCSHVPRFLDFLLLQIWCISVVESNRISPPPHQFSSVFFLDVPFRQNLLLARQFAAPQVFVSCPPMVVTPTRGVQRISLPCCTAETVGNVFMSRSVCRRFSPINFNFNGPLLLAAGYNEVDTLRKQSLQITDSIALKNLTGVLSGTETDSKTQWRRIVGNRICSWPLSQDDDLALRDSLETGYEPPFHILERQGINRDDLFWDVTAGTLRVARPHAVASIPDSDWRTYFLGTGSMYSTATRGTSSFVFQGGSSGESWLFDCGEGTQLCAQKTGVRIGKIRRIFVTHLHGDHCLGIPSFLALLSGAHESAGTMDRVIDIVGPEGLRTLLRCCLWQTQMKRCHPFRVHELLEVRGESKRRRFAERPPEVPRLPFELPDEENIRPDSDGRYTVLDLPEIRVVAAPIAVCCSQTYFRSIRPAVNSCWLWDKTNGFFFLLLARLIVVVSDAFAVRNDGCRFCFSFV
eukprot:GHVT01005698.1.p1 GENE.GHVT01005698.1~~GHVT01005698.1.p1  ORF type:complete len:476 (+),score=13.49 GHVT01005698.1:189-1616(+)